MIHVFGKRKDGVTVFDRSAHPNHDVMGVNATLHIHDKGGSIFGHSTQYYSDGMRISRSTSDGVHEHGIHWTNQNLPKGHPGRHQPPSK